MPGSYAHIALVNVACEQRKLKAIKGFPREAIDAAGLQLRFLELGSISPDYPYMNITSGDSKEWADAMHYTHTCNTVYTGGSLIQTLPEGVGRNKCLAWLMGYTAHVVADMCIHPVVELKVGQYEANKTGHRRCEMHQDVYIFRKATGVTMPQTSDHLNATIHTCSEQNDPTRLDKDVFSIWNTILRAVHESQFQNNLPDLDKWHQRCYGVLQKFLPTTSCFVGFARHACDGLGFSYPTPEEVDEQEFIKGLKVPGGKLMDYDEVFDFTVDQIRKVWREIARFALGLGDEIGWRSDEWNLDTGRNAIAGNKKLVFWEVA